MFIGIAALLALAGCGGGGGGKGDPGLGGPTNLVATGDFTKAGMVAFTWNSPGNTIDGFQMEGSTGTGDFTLITASGVSLIPSTWTGANLTWANNTPPEATDMHFRMRALSGTTYSAYSNIATVHDGIIPPTITSTLTSASGVDVKWTNNSLAADTLLVERGVYSGSAVTWTALTGPAFGATEVLDTQAPEMSNVTYRVTYSKGADQASASGYPVQTSMNAPDSLVVVPLIEGAKLTWKDHSPLATEVVVTRMSGLNSYGSYQDVAHLPATATSYSDLLLATGFYTYRVEARLANGASSPSLPVEVVTLPPNSGGPVMTPTLLALPGASALARDSKGGWFLAQGTNYSSWQIQNPAGVSYTLPSANAICDPTLQLDASDHPHTVFLRNVLQGSSQVAIVHAWYDGTAWQTEEMGRRTLNSGTVPIPLTFQVTAAGQVQAVWLKDGSATSGLEYAYKATDGTWKTESLDLVTPSIFNLGSYHLALDENGVPSVILGTWQTAYLLQRQGPGQWTWEQIPSGTLSAGWYDYLDLIISHSGDIHCIFSRSHVPWDSTSSMDLCELRKSGGAWTDIKVLQTVPFNGSGSTGYLAKSTQSDRLALSLPTSSVGQFLTYKEGQWVSSILGPASSNSRPCLGFDAKDKLYLLQQATYSYGTTTVPYVLYTEAP